MEVDEAANHIRELVDPDANIIWGAAFNNDLDGKIRVSVVATGIGAEEVLPMPQPAKVFAFPAARQMPEMSRDEEAAIEEAPAAAPITLTPPEEIAAEMPAEPVVAEAASEPAEMMLDESMAETVEGPSDELLLGGEMTADDMAEAPEPETRSWLTQEEPAPAASPITLTPPEEIAAETPAAPEMVAEAIAEPEEMMLDESMAETVEGPSDELLLGGEMTAEDKTETPEPETRSWLTQEEPAPAAETRPEAPRPAGTLFERMSSIARGAQKAQVPEADGEEAPRLKTGTRDPLDIPRFLNRQNNQ